MPRCYYNFVKYIPVSHGSSRLLLQEDILRVIVDLSEGGQGRKKHATLEAGNFECIMHGGEEQKQRNYLGMNLEVG